MINKDTVVFVMLDITILEDTVNNAIKGNFILKDGEDAMLPVHNTSSLMELAVIAKMGTSGFREIVEYANIMKFMME